MASNSSDSSDNSSDHLTLARWLEIKGELLSITEERGNVVVELSEGTVSFASGTPEAETIREELVEEIGQRISILRTDSAKNPIVVNVANDK